MYPLELSAPQSLFPIEIFDLIADHIDEPRHLLTLGLTCKALHNIVITRHIRYREVKCLCWPAENASAAWSDYVARPDRTKNIRRVDIDLPHAIAVLNMPGPPLGKAISLMRRLSYIRIRYPAFDPEDSTMLGPDNFIGSLSKCWEYIGFYGTLRDLDITLAARFFKHNAGIVNLRGLTSLRLTNGNGYFSKKMVEQLCKLVVDNPGLEVLSLWFPTQHFRLTKLFREASLPYLKTLKISVGLCTCTGCISLCPGCDETASDFLDRHSTIKTLHWSITSAKSPDISATLPCLSRLSGGERDVMKILSGSSQDPRQLFSIENLVVDEDFWYTIRPHINAATVRKLGVESFGSLNDILRLVEEFYLLEWLDINSTDPIWNNQTHLRRQLLRVEWVDALCRLPHLRVLRGLDFLGDFSMDEKNHAIATLDGFFPTLEFIDHWENPNYTIRLNRKGVSGNVSWEIIATELCEHLYDDTIES